MQCPRAHCGLYQHNWLVQVCPRSSVPLLALKHRVLWAHRLREHITEPLQWAQFTAPTPWLFRKAATKPRSLDLAPHLGGPVVKGSQMHHPDPALLENYS